jgi:hypothetical protein
VTVPDHREWHVLQMLSPGDDEDGGWADEATLERFADPAARAAELARYRAGWVPMPGLYEGARFRFVRRTEDVLTEPGDWDGLFSEEQARYILISILGKPEDVASFIMGLSRHPGGTGIRAAPWHGKAEMVRPGRWRISMSRLGRPGSGA